ncbi:MAG: N-acetyltransferase [Solirubrobacterales bacterium]|nr:N-acetyltransferase [Solirubrobacterales bacterium]
MITVENTPGLGRYQIRVDGEIAGYSAYEIHGDLFAFMHTEIEDRFAGQGLGVTLVARALDQIREQGGSILPYCPFVRWFLAHHPEYADLVPPDERGVFEFSDPDPEVEDDTA